MPELLFELGVEELPASAVRRASAQLAEEIVRRLEEAHLSSTGVTSLSTPRRLIVGIAEVPARQEDSSKDIRGPGLKAAFGPDGQPAPALLGFCKSQGVDPSEVRTEGDYVWVTKLVPGRATLEVLAELLPSAVRALTFDKTMRWGEQRMRFARPIRWILASFGGELVSFEIEGIPAGQESRGHRFNFPEAFSASDFETLVRELRSRQVEPDPGRRETMIRDGAARVATQGTPDLKPELVEENVFLTEWPVALEGEFRAEYLELPDAVLETAMAKHERFFPIRLSDGSFTNRFISIRNGGVDEVVRQGNAWVLNARFNDAKFFFDQDHRHQLDDFLAMTERMTFQEKLGNVRQRADRLAPLAAAWAQATGASEEEVEWARQAGLYAKADLSTGLVSELASLQGVIGGEYARREGFPEPVAQAISAHYHLDAVSDWSSPGGRTAVRLLAADQLDKLIGYLGLGLEPTGSSDPYGLRRAVTFLIEAAWRWPDRWPALSAVLPVGLRLYADQGHSFESESILKSLESIFRGRYEALLPDVRYDVRAAAIVPGEGASLDDPQVVRKRCQLMTQLAEEPAWIQTMTRPSNIVQAAVRKGEFTLPAESSATVLASIAPSSLDSGEGETLRQAALRAQEDFMRAWEADELAAMSTALQSLLGPINGFFESTMVMAEDPSVRQARLTLVAGVSQFLSRCGDWSQIVLEEAPETHPK